MKYPEFLIKLNKACAGLSGIIIFLSAAMSVTESIRRQFFNSPTIWSLNIMCYTFIWAAFLGSGYAFQEQGHVAVDLLRDQVDKWTKKTGRKARRIMSVIGYCCSFVVVYCFLFGGWKLCVRAITFNQMANFPFTYPLIIPYTVIVIGSVLMMITLIFIVLDLFSGSDRFL